MPPGYVYRGEAKGRLAALGVGVPAGEMVQAPIGAALIEHPSHGPILVDTGMKTDNRLGPLVGVVFRGLRIGPDENVPARLRAWGIAPQDVRTVVMTHLHADHTSAMADLPDAEFVVTPPEWAAATARLGALNGYVGGHLPPESSVRFVDVEADGVPHEQLTRTVDLLGDGSVRLVSTPGHSPGHQSVLVQAEEGPFFLLGDAVYTLRNLREDLLPLRTADDEASRRTLRELRAYAEAHPDVPLVPTHDEQVWDELAPADR
jgi:glyoxylase-like metal-dependent hydrolase (beta-lactamase superfamily II)